MIKFSIIIPTYKRVDLLNRAIISVLNQNYNNYEVLICSDGYSEEDEKCVLNINDNRFIYNHIEKIKVKNYGSFQRNAMILKCNGDYTIWLDDDNTIKKDYLSFSNNEIIENKYAMLICKIMHNKSGIIPKKNEINLAEIDTLNAMIKTDIAKKIIWGTLYDSDFYFIKEAEKHCLKNNLKIGFFEKIIGIHN